MTALLTLERGLQLNRLCGLILDSSEIIHDVAIIDKKGRVAENMMRDDRVTKNLTDQKREMLYMECALQLSMVRDFDDEFGVAKYTHSTREKVSIFSFLLDDYSIIVLSEPDTNPKVFSQHVIGIIELFEELP